MKTTQQQEADLAAWIGTDEARIAARAHRYCLWCALVAGISAAVAVIYWSPIPLIAASTCFVAGYRRLGQLQRDLDTAGSMRRTIQAAAAAADHPQPALSPRGDTPPPARRGDECDE